jgi:hypothetical protein
MKDEKNNWCEVPSTVALNNYEFHFLVCVCVCVCVCVNFETREYLIWASR